MLTQEQYNYYVAREEQREQELMDAISEALARKDQEDS